MNPERRRSPEPDSNAMSDKEAKKAMDSMSDNNDGNAGRGRMDASLDLSAERKKAEGIIEDRNLDQARLEEDLANVTKLVSEGPEKVQQDELIDNMISEADRKYDENFERWQADQKKIKELGEQSLADMRRSEQEAAAKKAEIVELSDEDLEDDYEELTEADIIDEEDEKEKKVEAAKADFQAITDEEIDFAMTPDDMRSGEMERLVEVRDEEEMMKEKPPRKPVFRAFQDWLARQRDRSETRRSLEQLQKMERDRVAKEKADKEAEESGRADFQAVTDEEIDAAVDQAVSGPLERRTPEEDKEEASELTAADIIEDEPEELTEADIIDEEDPDVVTSAPTMRELNKRLAERVSENEVEERFFEEGAELEAAGRLDFDVTSTTEAEARKERYLQHATKAGEMGYVQRADGDLIRGEGRHADLSDSARALSALRKKLKETKEAYDKMPWYKKLMTRGAIRRLESQIDEAKDRLAESRQALRNPEGHRAAKKLQSERRK